MRDGKVHVDIGRATAVELPEAETERRWKATTSQWPIMHVLLEGITRDQFMARHHANHVNVAYAPTAEIAGKALAAKAAMFAELGVKRTSLRHLSSPPARRFFYERNNRYDSGGPAIQDADRR